MSNQTQIQKQKKTEEFYKAKSQFWSDQLAIGMLSLISVIVLSFLIWLIYFAPRGVEKFWWIDVLPALNATLNGITTLLLLLGFSYIKKGKRKEHIKAMLSATATSGLFLISYILYHHFHGDSKFLGTGLIRGIYFFILITHVLLSMIMVPMVFITLYYGLRGRKESHKKIAKKTFPIWLYVSFTGVLIFFFLKINA